jgi:hypothetical protein
MKYERQEEKDFDDWFYKLPAKDQQRWRDKGVLPYAEQPVPGNVFPIIANHPLWPTTGKEESVQMEECSFMSEHELRGRLVELFRILDRFADGTMHLHLVFIRTLLGENTGCNLAQLSKRFGLTKQAVFWRVRQIRKAMGTLASGKITWARERTPENKAAFAKSRKVRAAPLLRQTFNNEPQTRKGKKKTHSVLQRERHDSTLSSKRGKAKGVCKAKVSANKGETAFSNQRMVKQKQGKARNTKSRLDSQT